MERRGSQKTRFSARAFAIFHWTKAISLHARRRFTRVAGDESGSIKSSMLVTSVLLILGGSVTNTAIFESRDVHRHLHQTQAAYLAQAGVERARYDMIYQSFSDLLKGPDGIPDTADDGALSFGETVWMGGGSYAVVIADNADGGDPFNDSDGIVNVNSTGTVRGQSHGVVATLAEGDYQSPHAIVAGGDLEISANASINGASGSIHANGNLTIGGNPNVERDATASGYYTASGSPTIGGISGGGRPPRPIPAVVPSDYLSHADYILKGNGNVEDPFGNVIATDIFQGWVWGGGKWDFGSDFGTDGTYYIEGDAIVNGNPGSGGNPWQVTIIAEGSVEISGNPQLAHKMEGLLVVAGGDLKINGNPEMGMAGHLLTHEQLLLSGNPFIVGAIVAEDATDMADFAIETKISGELNLYYDDNMDIPSNLLVPDKPKIMSWRRN